MPSALLQALERYVCTYRRDGVHRCAPTSCSRAAVVSAGERMRAARMMRPRPQSCRPMQAWPPENIRYESSENVLRHYAPTTVRTSCRRAQLLVAELDQAALLLGALMPCTGTLGAFASCAHSSRGVQQAGSKRHRQHCLMAHESRGSLQGWLCATYHWYYQQPAITTCLPCHAAAHCCARRAPKDLVSVLGMQARCCQQCWPTSLVDLIRMPAL